MLTTPERRTIFADDHAAFRDSVRRFVAAEVSGRLDDWRRDDGTPRAVVGAAGAAGFLSISLPEEFGGAGVEDRGFLSVLIEETVGAGATGLALLWALHSGVIAPAIADFGTAAARQRWLPGLAGGDLLGVPAPAGNVSLDGSVLSGELTNVPFGRLADVLLVTVTEGAGAGCTVLVDTDAPGVTAREVGGNLAARDAGLADVTLDAVEIDDTAMLNAGKLLRRDTNLWLAVVAVAAARSTHSLAVEYTRERKVFGRALAEFENTRLRLAELAAGLATTTAYVDSCLAGGDTVDPAAAAVAQVSAAQVHDRCVDQALQLHGGYGYMREYPVSHAFADARFLRLLTEQYTGIGRTLPDDLGL